MLHPRANAMLAFALPALIIGSASSLVLLLMMKVAATLQQWLWVTLPDALSLDAQAPWWPLGMLTLTGVAVGLIVRYMPGRIRRRNR